MASLTTEEVLLRRRCAIKELEVQLSSAAAPWTSFQLPEGRNKSYTVVWDDIGWAFGQIASPSFWGLEVGTWDTKIGYEMQYLHYDNVHEINEAYHSLERVLDRLLDEKTDPLTASLWAPTLRDYFTHLGILPYEEWLCEIRDETVTK